MLRGKLLGCVLAGLVGTVTIGGAGVAAAGEPPMASPLGRLIAGVVGHYLVFRSEFSLTPQQREKIHQAIRQHKAELGKAVAEVWKKRNVLRDDVLAGKDEASIRKAADFSAWRRLQALGYAATFAAFMAGRWVAGESVTRGLSRRDLSGAPSQRGEWHVVDACSGERHRTSVSGRLTKQRLCRSAGRWAAICLNTRLVIVCEGGEREPITASFKSRRPRRVAPLEGQAIPHALRRDGAAVRMTRRSHC